MNKNLKFINKIGFKFLIFNRQETKGINIMKEEERKQKLIIKLEETEDR